MLLQIEDPAHIDLVRQLVQAYAYWRLKGLAVDLVIWNEDHAGYRQLLHDQIMGLIASGTEANLTDRPNGIFVRPEDQISEEDRILFQMVARAIINTETDPNTGALLARNPYNTEFCDRTAFFDVDDTTRTFSRNRTEFLGRNRMGLWS